MAALPDDDLDHIVRHTSDLWTDLDGRRVFVTGGTGFFGRWALEGFSRACDRLKLNAQAVVLTRRPEAFRRAAPHLANHPAISTLDGDVRGFAFPSGEFSAILHMATDADVGLIDREPVEMVNTIIDGTRHVLEFAKSCGARKLLHTSSGAIYGKQPVELSHVSEDYNGAPFVDAARASYAEAKRMAEVLCVLAHQTTGLESVNARCFAFVGPLLPTGRGYAIGNFLGDALAGRPIRLTGDGTPVRSYLYGADLAIWIWTLLLRGAAGRSYNVGSEVEVSIADAARTVSESFDPPARVEITGSPVPGRLPDRYVPCTERARTELGLKTRIEFGDAVRKTARWMRAAMMN